MKFVEVVINVKEVEKKVEKEYKVFFKILKSLEYFDFRVFFLRMIVDIIFYRRFVEVFEKVYKEVIELIEEFGYVDVFEMFEIVLGNQVFSGFVLILGILVVQVVFYGFFGSRILFEDVFEELFKNFLDNVVFLFEKFREIRDKLEKFRVFCEKMSENYRIFEQNVVYLVVQVFVESVRKNEEQYKVVVDGLLKRYLEEK